MPNFDEEMRTNEGIIFLVLYRSYNNKYNSSGWVPATWNAEGMHYSPYLCIENAGAYKIMPNNNNKFDAVFGFRNVNDILKPTLKDYPYLKLSTTVKNWDPNGELVLSDPWPDDQLERNHSGKNGQGIENNKNYDFNEFNGLDWYLVLLFFYNSQIL